MAKAGILDLSCLFQVLENTVFKEIVLLMVLLGGGGWSRAFQGLLLTNTSSFCELSEQVFSAKTCCLPTPVKEGSRTGLGLSDLLQLPPSSWQTCLD